MAVRADGVCCIGCCLPRLPPPPPPPPLVLRGGGEAQCVERRAPDFIMEEEEEDVLALADSHQEGLHHAFCCLAFLSSVQRPKHSSPAQTTSAIDASMM